MFSSKIFERKCKEKIKIKNKKNKKIDLKSRNYFLTPLQTHFTHFLFLM